MRRDVLTEEEEGRDMRGVGAVARLLPYSATSPLSRLLPHSDTTILPFCVLDDRTLQWIISLCDILHCSSDIT